MAQAGWPFEEQPTTETQYYKLAREWQDTGVVDAYGGNALKVTANSSGMQVTVQPGPAMLVGGFYESTAAETVPIPAASSSPRDDLVLVRLDPAANTIALAVKQGTPAVNPSPPALTQNVGGVWELELARVRVVANAATIAAGNVTERRIFVGQRTRTWDTGTRPANPRRGLLGFNVTTDKWEFYSGAGWVDLIPSTVENANNAARVGGLELIRSATTPTGTPSTNRLWFKPLG